MSKLFVGNLPFDTTDEELRSWVEAKGHQVEEVRLITERDTGKPRGFGFVTIDGPAIKAASNLNGQDFKGRSLTVNEAKPQEPRDGGDARRRREPRW